MATENKSEALTRTSAALMKDSLYPKDEATIPAASGPVVWPISMTEPRRPIAEPWVSFRERSAIYAEVADVTIERLRPKRMLNTSSRRNEEEREKAAMERAPNSEPAMICDLLPCLSENLPIIGFVIARVRI